MVEEEETTADTAPLFDRARVRRGNRTHLHLGHGDFVGQFFFGQVSNHVLCQVGAANIAVGIPTFNRPADCVNALAALTSDPLVDKVISAVIVSDQGTKKAKDAFRDFVVSVLAESARVFATKAVTGLLGSLFGGLGGVNIASTSIVETPAA